MPRAVLKNGLIYPLEPLPLDWTDGKELWVDETTQQDDTAEDDTAEAIDRWYHELEAMVAHNDPKDLERLETALREADEEAKALMRREMGLP